MKKIFCIFIMFCICIVNAWAGCSPCPLDTLKKIGNWTSACAYETGEAAEELRKCIEYFNDNCGCLYDSNTDTPVASGTVPDCTAFEGENFEGIEDYLEKQVKANCTPQAGECPYKDDIASWKEKCKANKGLLSQIKAFETACGQLPDPKTVINPADNETIESRKKKLEQLVNAQCYTCSKKSEIDDWHKKCGTGLLNIKDLNDMILKYEKWCKEGFKANYFTEDPYKGYTEEGFREKIQAEVNKKCVAAPEDKNKKVSGNVNYATITGYGSALDGIIGNLDLSVWKNADGKFNTARLASDSIAGVVLGTAGGLITSSVMKKHQAADGFEDLKCVVGGQSVAGWGDVFNVGIQ